MSTVSSLADTVTTTLTAADPADFIAPIQQDILLKEWGTIEDLQETNANPHAVVANIDNFQRSVNRWVDNPTLLSDLNQTIDLYRSAYLADNPAANQ